MNYRIVSLILMLTAPPLTAMKRPAEEIEELQEQKPAKVPARETEEFAFYPEWLDEALKEIEEKKELVQEQHAESGGKAFEALPKDLKVYIMRFLLPAKGDTKEFQLQVAANNIRSFMQISKAFKPLLDDSRVNGEVIEMLAKRYMSEKPTKAQRLHVALVLQTTGAGKWLAEREKEYENLIIDALFKCAERNQVEKCMYLLRFLPDLVNERKKYAFNEDEDQEDEITLLMLAITTNNLPLMDELLALPDIDINQRSADGNTALQYIFLGSYGPEKRNQLPMVQRLLVREDLDINIIHPGNITALGEAAFNATDEAFAALLADPRIDVNLGRPDPLYAVAIDTMDLNKLKMLLDTPTIDTTGILEMAEALLEEAQEKGKKLAYWATMRRYTDREIAEQKEIENDIAKRHEIIRLLKVHGAQKQTESKMRGFKPY